MQADILHELAFLANQLVRPFCLSVSFEEMILPRLKRSILVHSKTYSAGRIAAGVYFEGSFVSIIPHTYRRSAQIYFYGKNITEYF